MTTERNHDIKFDKGTIYIVYFHAHVHVHIEKIGNISKSKHKLYICANKLRSCAQFAPRGKCAPSANLLRRICTTYKVGANSHPDANLHPGAFSYNTVYMTKIHPRCKFTPQLYICTGVYIVHINEALDKDKYFIPNYLITSWDHFIAPVRKP